MIKVPNHYIVFVEAIYFFPHNILYKTAIYNVGFYDIILKKINKKNIQFPENYQFISAFLCKTLIICMYSIK